MAATQVDGDNLDGDDGIYGRLVKPIAPAVNSAASVPLIR